jgi:hypothetical protein
LSIMTMRSAPRKSALCAASMPTGPQPQMHTLRRRHKAMQPCLLQQLTHSA